MRCFGQVKLRRSKYDMNKKFLLALMLTTGLAFAQQKPSTQQQPPTSDQTSQTPTSAGQNSLTGCLKGSGDAWVLVAEGQSTPLSGDSSTLKPHNGHQVQVKGSQASDGSFQVTDIVMIAESCPGNQASSAGGAVTGAAGATAGAVAAGAEKTADATQTAAGNAADATKNAASDAASATQSATAPSQNPAPSATTPSQSPAPSDGTQAANNKLPQTASPLPLLGLLGLGSVVSGLIARRKK
jgi:colicin import membrane protein